MRKIHGSQAAGTLARQGEANTVRVDGKRCPRCGGRMQTIRDYYSNDIRRVCRGGSCA